MQPKTNLVFFILFFFSLFSCRKDKELGVENDYHIVLVCGQSNTHFGIGFDAILDAEHPQILQLGRFDGNDLNVIQATEPLDHHTRQPGSIGFALTFAKLYAAEYLNVHEKLLIIPCGASGSGFMKGNWNVGNPLFEDAAYRYHYIKEKFPHSHLAAVLWHQGESDIHNEHYETDLDDFIHSFRANLASPNVPFILGGMNPYWVKKDSIRIVLQETIKNTPNRVSATGYADPEWPFVINKEINEFNAIHYDANGLRELGKRYFEVYQTLR